MISATAQPMVSVTTEPEYRIHIEESCGIAHERQVLTVALPAWGDEIGYQRAMLLEDRNTGKLFPLQSSKANSGQGFLQVEIHPEERLELAVAEPPRFAEDVFPVTVKRRKRGYRLANDRLAIYIARSGTSATNDIYPAGPIRGICRRQDRRWRGHTYFDTRQTLRWWKTEVIEEATLRSVVRYSAAFDGNMGLTYEATFTLDAGSDFVRIEERWQGHAPGDQLVWDFSGEDLPNEILRLDSTAGCAREPLHYLFDRRLCRLFAWTQQSQLSDLSDGYALSFPAGDSFGFVALEGGGWSGNRLNHLEAWTRRWIRYNPASRRNVPDGAKRDVMPGPDRIPARGESRTTPHLTIEGWIGESGSRSWALVVAKTADLLPGAGADIVNDLDRGCSTDRRHFDSSPDRARDRRESSRLRRIHTQHGLLPLEALARTVFHWPVEEPPATGLVYPDPILEEHMRHRERELSVTEALDARERRRKGDLLDSLAARVYGFWAGGGSAATNPVVSRDIAPRMLQYEYLARTGQLTEAENTQIRAWFAFLITLFGSDNYYPGLATMLPADHPDSVEPTLEGMANQNFYTDVVNIPGMGAEVFRGHPEAGAWRDRFGAHWSRQIAYHSYPLSGVWEESHTYFQHVLHTVLPTLLRRRDRGVNDGFADPAFQRLVGGAVCQISPRDSRFAGNRYLVPFGDHSAGHHTYFALYKPYAEAFAPHAPELAGRLAWMYREMGGEEPLSVEPIAPPCEPEAAQGLGYFLRGLDGEGQEFLLALRSGAAWGHHHQDDGSLQFWAKGYSRIVDAGFGEWIAGKRKFSDSGHSRWALTDFPAQNYLYRFNRGWITTHEESGHFPYAVAFAPVYLQNPAPQTVAPLPGAGFASHVRAIVRIGPCAFLIADYAETGLAQTVRFHLPETTVTPAGGGIAAHYSDGCRLTLCAILPGQPPLTISGGDPLPHGKATFEVSAPLSPEKGISRSVCLLAADDPTTEPPSIASASTEEPVEAHLRGHGFSVRLRFEGAGLHLLDELSGGERTISLDPPHGGAV